MSNLTASVAAVGLRPFLTPLADKNPVHASDTIGSNLAIDFSIGNQSGLQRAQEKPKKKNLKKSSPQSQLGLKLNPHKSDFKTISLN